MTKGILGAEGPRQGFHINTGEPGKRPNKSQDTAKESYIVCEECEDYFGVLETYFAEYIHKRIRVSRFDQDFEYQTNPGGVNFAISKDRELLVIKLFFLSIYWRASITSTFPFTNFKIEPIERLRDILFRYKTTDINELKGKSDHELNRIQLVVMRSEKGVDETANFLYSIESDDGTYGLILNEYMTFVAFNESATTRKMEYLTNKDGSPFKLILLQNQIWDSFKQTMMGMMKDLSFKVASEKGVEPWLSKTDPNRR